MRSGLTEFETFRNWSERERMWQRGKGHGIPGCLASRVGGLRGIAGKKEAFEVMESQVPPNGGNMAWADTA